MSNDDDPEAVDADATSVEENNEGNQQPAAATAAPVEEQEKGVTLAASSRKQHSVSSPFGYRKGHFMRWKDLRMVAVVADGGGKGSRSGHSSDNASPSADDDATGVKQERVILNNVSGAAPAGQVTAIMGPRCVNHKEIFTAVDICVSCEDSC